MYGGAHKKTSNTLTGVRKLGFFASFRNVFIAAMSLALGEKKPPDFAVGGLCRLQGRAVYIVSMKLRSLSERLGCLSLRSALASI